MAHLVYLSGVPGVGKTTVATRLHGEGIERVHFGGILRQAVEVRRGIRISHEEFRATFTTLVDMDILLAATRLARRVADESTAEVCVLDSHAVSPTALGLRVTPDDPDRLATLRFSTVVHLSADECVERVVANSHVDGRFRLRPAEVRRADGAQLAVCVMYAAMSNCPLHIVSAAADADTVTSLVRQVLTADERT